MEIIFIVVAIIIFMITLNLFISVKFSYDFVQNIGKIKIKIFFITIINNEVSLIAGYFNFIRKNKKVIQIKFDFNDKNFKFLEDAGKFFIEKLILTDMKYEVDIGFDNPAILSILVGVLTFVNEIIKQQLSLKYNEVQQKSNVNINYFSKKLHIFVNFKVIITIYDFIWAFVKAGVKRSLYGKKRKFARNS